MLGDGGVSRGCVNGACVGGVWCGMTDLPKAGLGVEKRVCRRGEERGWGCVLEKMSSGYEASSSNRMS